MKMMSLEEGCRKCNRRRQIEREDSGQRRPDVARREMKERVGVARRGPGVRRSNRAYPPCVHTSFHTARDGQNLPARGAKSTVNKMPLGAHQVLNGVSRRFASRQSHL